MDQILTNYEEKYFKRFVSLDHVVEGVIRQIIVNDLLFIFVVLVGVFEVDVDYFLDLFAGLLDFAVFLIDLIHHLAVKHVIIRFVERVLIKYRLGKLPNLFLNILDDKKTTLTRRRII